MHNGDKIVSSINGAVKIGYPNTKEWDSLVAQLVKSPLVMWETWVHSLCWEDSLLPTPVFWPREIHGKRNLRGYSPWGCKESDITQ